MPGSRVRFPPFPPFLRANCAVSQIAVTPHPPRPSRWLFRDDKCDSAENRDRRKTESQCNGLAEKDDPAQRGDDRDAELHARGVTGLEPWQRRIPDRVSDARRQGTGSNRIADSSTIY